MPATIGTCHPIQTGSAPPSVSTARAIVSAGAVLDLSVLHGWRRAAARRLVAATAVIAAATRNGGEWRDVT